MKCSFPPQVSISGKQVAEATPTFGALTYFIGKKTAEELIRSHWTNVIYKLVMHPNFLFYS